MRWLGSVAEAAPLGMILSRRLAAATIVDTRGRWPLLYPPVGVEERRATVATLARLAAKASATDLKTWLLGLVDTLSLSWDSAEVRVHHMGAMATAPCGLPNLAASVYRRATGRDANIEILSAGADVEWAAALGATVCPTEVDGGYSAGRATDVVASFFSLDGRERVASLTPEAFMALDGILAVDSDVPIVSFASEFSSSEIARLRTLVLGIAAWNQDPEFLQQAVDDFNAMVRRYERKSDRLRTMNIAGFAGSLAVAATVAANEQMKSTLAPFAFLGPALAAWLFTIAREELAARSLALSSLIDFANGRMSGVSADAVLVSRLRKEVKLHSA
jgi:hypothetical protein